MFETRLSRALLPARGMWHDIIDMGHFLVTFIIKLFTHIFTRYFYIIQIIS